MLISCLCDPLSLLSSHSNNQYIAEFLVQVFIQIFFLIIIAEENCVAINTVASFSQTSSQLMSINVVAQLLVKLTLSNFPSQRAQFHSLLVDYELLGYLDGSNNCPMPTIIDKDTIVPNPTYMHQQRQVQIFLYAILASLFEVAIPLVASTSTLHNAWTCLAKLYASKSRSRMMHLKE